MHPQAFCKCQEQSTRYILLRTLQLLSATPTNCNHMLSVGAAQLICDSFALPDPEQQYDLRSWALIFEVIINFVLN